MTHWLDLGFADRILPFDSAAARVYAEIAASRRRAGLPIDEADCRIAAITRRRGAALVTRNVRDFGGEISPLRLPPVEMTRGQEGLHVNGSETRH